MKILVCGGAGYIGSHTVKELLSEGFEVVVLDNFSSGRRVLLVGGEVIAADLNDQKALRKVFRRGDIGAVLHFASLIQVGESYLQPHKYYSHNLITSLNLLGAMIEAGIERLIFSSSAAVYGIPDEIPIPESHPLRPYNPYGRAKLFIEQILQDCDRAYGIKSISLRYFNAAGADPDAEIGENHNPETHLIPLILDVALGRRNRLEIFGTDYDTLDGTCIRDYIHVSDLAIAHLLALEYLKDGGQNDVFNLGNGNGFSVREVMTTAIQITGCDIPYSESERRTGDPSILIGSSEKIRKTLGWKPSYDSLETIIKTAWRWHKNR